MSEQPMAVAPATPDRFSIRPCKYGTGRFRLEYNFEADNFEREITEVLNAFWNLYPGWKPTKLVLGGSGINRYHDGALKGFDETAKEAMRPKRFTEGELQFAYDFESITIERSYDLDNGEALIAAYRRK